MCLAISLADINAPDIRGPSTPDAVVASSRETPGPEHTNEFPTPSLQADHAETLETERSTNALIEAFDRSAAMLRDPNFDLDSIWENANDKERRVLVEELIEAVTIYADRLEVTVTGAPPLLVTLAEVGLRDPGTGPVVSEDRSTRSRYHALEAQADFVISLRTLRNLFTRSCQHGVGGGT